ncbi:hypothetical protein P152DRAFT_346202 [Eremomyces bilateralis CBS 781.70]|uniref:Uncharacterized protein n=1 Tax=Eremomyces bilateralis CBS 781.70 TaxID=1392243 RepID=A0A6G1G417_9PEZI|nr:uncharacterized protein P152DRAFT_346202 [Eremomyces bilateralis CBS 781.70]KAF1812681.1 hypothetical protein P152DRAFT_346202 [Eremomyces bilateralis CBS 781.70]
MVLFQSFHRHRERRVSATSSVVTLALVSKNEYQIMGYFCLSVRLDNICQGDSKLILSQLMPGHYGPVRVIVLD